MEFIYYQDYKLAYKKTDGSFPPLLLFHGYGQTHAAFNPLVEALKNKYTCYSFDIFYHGESRAPKDQPLEPETWNHIFELFLKKEQLEDFSLGGFSLGGKYIVSILMEYAPRISNIILMAPDGIKSNIWYDLATYPAPLRKLFKSMVRYPQRFYFISRSLRRLGVIDKSVGRFIEKQMQSPTQRTRIYDTWVGVRPLKFKTREIKRKLIEHDIETSIFLARKDYIIPLKPFIRFCKKIPSCNLRILDCGHYNLIKTVAGYYSENSNAHLK